MAENSSNQSRYQSDENGYHGPFGKVMQIFAKRCILVKLIHTLFPFLTAVLRFMIHIRTLIPSAKDRRFNPVYAS